MPTSHYQQLNQIIEVISLIDPQSLLDVGVGFGKYGVLAREVLELLDGREVYGDWLRQIDGIEIFPGYLTPLHAFVYDNVYVGDALDLLPGLETQYDLVLLIDVLEHFTRQDGMRLLDLCRQAGSNVLVSTPRLFWEQPDIFGNPRERHLSHWRSRDFVDHSPKCFLPNDISLICLIGESAPQVKARVSSPRRWLKAWFPWLKYPYRFFKDILRAGKTVGRRLTSVV